MLKRINSYSCSTEAICSHSCSQRTCLNIYCPPNVWCRWLDSNQRCITIWVCYISTNWATTAYKGLIGFTSAAYLSCYAPGRSSDFYPFLWLSSALSFWSRLTFTDSSSAGLRAFSHHSCVRLSRMVRLPAFANGWNRTNLHRSRECCLPISSTAYEVCGQGFAPCRVRRLTRLVGFEPLCPLLPISL